MIVLALLVAAIFVAMLGLFGAVTFKTACLLSLAFAFAAFAVERVSAHPPVARRRVP